MLIITIIQVCDFIDGIPFPNLESVLVQLRGSSTTVWASRAEEDSADPAEKPNTSHTPKPGWFPYIYATILPSFVLGIIIE